MKRLNFSAMLEKSSEAVNQKTDNIVAKSKEQRIKSYTES